MKYFRLSMLLIVVFVTSSIIMATVGCSRAEVISGTAIVIDQNGQPVIDMPLTCIPSIDVTRLSFESGPATIAPPLPFKTNQIEQTATELFTNNEGSVTWTGRANQIKWRLGRRPGFLPISDEAWRTQTPTPALNLTHNSTDRHFRLWRLTDPTSLPILVSLRGQSELLPIPGWTALRWTAQSSNQPVALLMRCVHQEGAWTIQLRAPQPGIQIIEEKHLGAVPELGYRQELLLRSPPTPSENKTIRLPLIVSRIDLLDSPFRVFSAIKMEIQFSSKSTIIRMQARADITGGNCLLEPSWDWNLQSTASPTIEYSDPLPPALTATRITASSPAPPLPLNGWDDLTQEIAHTSDHWIIRTPKN